MTVKKLHRYRSRDTWIWIIINQLEVFVLEVEDILHVRIDFHLRKGARLAGELCRNLLKMIDIDMRIARLLQPLKALEPMLVTLSGISTLCRLVQLAKALEAIPTTL